MRGSLQGREGGGRPSLRMNTNLGRVLDGVWSSNCTKLQDEQWATDAWTHVLIRETGLRMLPLVPAFGFSARNDKVYLEL